MNEWYSTRTQTNSFRYKTKPERFLLFCVRLKTRKGVIVILIGWIMRFLVELRILFRNYVVAGVEFIPRSSARVLNVVYYAHKPENLH